MSSRILSWEQLVREADPDHSRLSLRPWVYEFSNGRRFLDPLPLYGRPASVTEAILLMQDGTSGFLLQDGTSLVLLESSTAPPSHAPGVGMETGQGSILLEDASGYIGIER